MLSSITKICNIKSGDFSLKLFRSDQENSEVLRNIDKHLEVLHHRNWQLRNAIMAKSESNISKRHAQFTEVLRSYVRLIVVELHGPVEGTSHLKNTPGYTEIRENTFTGYEGILERSNLTSKEILNNGSEFARELFLIELRLKQYYETQKKHIYPLFNAVSK